ncbi:MAG: ComEC/Rec2 family competence protein [Anaerolineaceae bacterium]|nr:ComEC/Rec2 family competence protein [Anaerolineaceae bacterium]
MDQSGSSHLENQVSTGPASRPAPRQISAQKPLEEALPSKNQPSEGKGEIRIPAIKPFFWLALAALLGPLAAEQLKLDWGPWLLLSFFGLLFAFLEKGRRPRLLPSYRLPSGLALGAFALSAMLYVLSLPPFTPQFAAYYNEKGDLDLQVLVIEPPEWRDGRQNLIAKIERIEPLYMEAGAVDYSKIRGKVLIQAEPGLLFRYGDRLRVRGELKTPAEGAGFDYRAYLRHRGITSTISFARIQKIAGGQGNPILQAVYRLKLHASAALEKLFPPRESALLKGVLLGDANYLPEDLKAAYALTGTAHIYAISGFNMVVLASLVTHLFTRRRTNWKTVLGVIATLCLYTILVGGSASVVRAAIMGAYALVGGLIGRKGNLLNTLGFTVFLMVLLNPHLPWDIGFQLTLMATLGLALFSAPLMTRLQNRISDRYGEAAANRWGGLVGEYFIVTLIAQFSVLPLILYHFRQVSALFLLANPLVLPVQPLVMLLGLAAILGGLISLPLGRLLAFLAWPFAAYTNAVVRFLAARLPKALRLPHLDFAWVLVFYAAFAFLALGKKEKFAKTCLTPNLLLVVTALAALMVWVFAAGKPQGSLKLRILPAAGQVNLILSTPAGRHLLIGGAGSANELVSALSEALPITHLELDWLIIPHCGRSDVSALFSLPGQVRITKVLWLCNWERIQTTQSLFDRYAQLGISQRKALPEDSLLLGARSSLYLDIKNGLLQGVFLNTDSFSLAMPAKGNENTPSANLLILENKLVLNNPASFACALGQSSAYAPLDFNKYRWLEINSSKKGLFLSGQLR